MAPWIWKEEAAKNLIIIIIIVITRMFYDITRKGEPTTEPE